MVLALEHQKGEVSMRMIDADTLPYENQVLSYDDEWCLKVSDIENAPTVEAEPVIHARWVLRQSNGYAVCSHCQRGDHVDPLATHCRYCGAKMDLEG